MEQELVRREVSDGAILVVALEGAEPIEDGFGYRGFVVRLRATIATRTERDAGREDDPAYFWFHRDFWCPAHGATPAPHSIRLSEAAGTLADTLGALWDAGGKNYRLLNSGFLKAALEAVPLT